MAELDALDAARRDRLRAQEERPDRLESSHAFVGVELPDRELGVVDRACRVEAHSRIDPRDQSRQERAVDDAFAALAATRDTEIALPVPLDPTHVPVIPRAKRDALQQSIA